MNIKPQKVAKRTLSLFLSILMAFSVCAVGAYALDDDITLVPPDVEESTTEESFDLMDKIENIDLGIDGYAITAKFNALLDRINAILALIIQFVTDKFSGALDFGSFSNIAIE